MGGAGGQNIKHPHTLAILIFLFFFFFFLQMHFSFIGFIGKAQFKRATLFCDSSYSLPPCVRGWLRLLLVALAGLFCLLFCI